MFERDLFERFSRVHPVTPALVWTPVIGACLVASVDSNQLSAARISAGVALGFALWTLVEYVVHRFLFHAEPIHPTLRRVAYMLHGVHHDAPDDPRRLLMPPLPAAGFAALAFVGFVVVLGEQLALPCFAGFGLGYLAYDYTHLALHHGRVRFGFLRRLKKHHMRHHHADFDAGFGVSSTLWDRVFNTLPSTGRPASGPKTSSRTPRADRSAP